MRSWQSMLVLLIFVGVRSMAQTPVQKYRQRVVYLMENKKYSAALRWLDTLIRIDPNEAENYARQGDIYKTTGRYKDANESYTKLLKLDPASNVGRLLRAGTWNEIHQPDSAIKDLNKIFGVQRKLDSTIYLLRATSYYNLGSFASAKKDLDAYALFGPKDNFFYLLRANIRSQLNENAAAIEDLTVLINRNVSDTLIRKRAFLYSITGEFAKCISDCNSYLSKAGTDGFIVFTRGLSFLSLKNYYKASEDFETCTKMNLKSDKLVACRGIANYFLAHDEKAIEDLTKAWARDQSNVQILVMIAVCKHNLKPGSGCLDLRNAAALGSEDASHLIIEYCQ